MLLNNFRRILVNSVASSLSISSFDSMTGEVKTTYGNIYYPKTASYKKTPNFSGMGTYSHIAITDTSYNGNYVPSNSFSLNSCYLFLGDGDIPPTIEDYKLSGNLITGLHSQSQLHTVNNNSIVFSAIATNNTTNPVTIKEIGFGGTYSNVGDRCAVLLTRDVLPTPVTLNTGDSKTFSVTIDFRSLTDSTVNV